MNPEVKKIGNKLFDKVELASEKIELALVDDIKALISKYKSLDDNVKTARGKAANGLISYTDNIRVAYQNAENAVNMISELEAKSKELGLGDTPFTSYKKDLSAKSSDYKKLFTAVDNLTKSL